MLRGEPAEAIEAHKENLENIYRKKVARCFYVSLGCSVIGLLAGVFAAFFILNLGFCQEEDLMPFYWATYTVLVAGSIIAIFGLNIGLYYMKSPQNRPWNASLGTPVIALVSILDVIFHAIKGAAVPKKNEKEKGQEALLPMYVLSLLRQETVSLTRDVKVALDVHQDCSIFTPDCIRRISTQRHPRPFP